MSCLISHKCPAASTAAAAEYRLKLELVLKMQQKYLVIVMLFSFYSFPPLVHVKYLKSKKA